MAEKADDSDVSVKKVSAAATKPKEIGMNEREKLNQVAGEVKQKQKDFKKDRDKKQKEAKRQVKENQWTKVHIQVLTEVEADGIFELPAKLRTQGNDGRWQEIASRLNSAGVKTGTKAAEWHGRLVRDHVTVMLSEYVARERLERKASGVEPDLLGEEGRLLLLLDMQAERGKKAKFEPKAHKEQEDDRNKGLSAARACAFSLRDPRRKEDESDEDMTILQQEAMTEEMQMRKDMGFNDPPVLPKKGGATPKKGNGAAGGNNGKGGGGLVTPRKKRAKPLDTVLGEYLETKAETQAREVTAKIKLEQERLDLDKRKMTTDEGHLELEREKLKLDQAKFSLDEEERRKRMVTEDALRAEIAQLRAFSHSQPMFQPTPHHFPTY